MRSERATPGIFLFLSVPCGGQFHSRRESSRRTTHALRVSVDCLTEYLNTNSLLLPRLLLSLQLQPPLHCPSLENPSPVEPLCHSCRESKSPPVPILDVKALPRAPPREGPKVRRPRRSRLARGYRPLKWKFCCSRRQLSDTAI